MESVVRRNSALGFPTTVLQVTRIRADSTFYFLLLDITVHLTKQSVLHSIFFMCLQHTVAQQVAPTW